MQIMHVSAQSTNLKFTVPVSSTTIQRQTQPVLECRSSQHFGQIIGTETVASADCDTEDEVNNHRHHHHYLLILKKKNLSFFKLFRYQQL